MAVSDLQGDITFTVPEYGKITPEGPNTITADGMVHYIDSFTGFWGTEADKPGYYLAFTVNSEYDIDWSKVTLTMKGSAVDSVEKVFKAGELTDGTFVLYLGNDASAFTDFTFTIDIDGEGTLYEATTYTLDTQTEKGGEVSGITAFQYIIEFIDSQNNVILTEKRDEGAMFQIPYAGAGVGFTGWATEVVNGEDPENFNFASVMVVTSIYDVNMDGKITLTATYGETPVDPVGPSDPATTVYPGIVKGDEVIITLVGEIETGYGYIPAGTLTIEYTAVEWTDFGGQMVPMPKTYELTVDVTEGQMAVHISADQFQSFENIIGINVTYTSIDGGLTGYNSAIYNVTLTAPTNE